MSNNDEKWIEKAISEKHIKYYEYEHFSNIQEIGSGAFGKVYQANYRKSHAYKYFALKSYNAVKEIVHEVIIKIRILLTGKLLMAKLSQSLTSTGDYYTLCF